MTHGVCELLWIKSVLKDLGVVYTQLIIYIVIIRQLLLLQLHKILYDMTTPNMLRLIVTSSRRNWIKKLIQFPFIKSENQLVDILIKAVSGKVFHDIINKLGMTH